jgi:hypothetical protein
VGAGRPPPAPRHHQPPGTPRASAGVLGLTTTTVVYGGRFANTEGRSGGRAELGYYFDDRREFGIEGGLFALESSSKPFVAASDGTTILARPFTDVTARVAASSLIGFPGSSSGTVSVNDSARNLDGFNFAFRENFYTGPWGRVGALLGYRYLRYDERLQIQQSTLPTGAPFAPGTNIVSTDNFGTHNIFNGVDLGLRGELWFGAFSVELLGKVAVGVLDRAVIISGSQVVSVPGVAPVTNPGGLLALASNSGAFKSHTDSAVPELGITLGWQVTPNVRVRAGYTVLWLPNAARPGEQVNLAITPGLIPPATTQPTATTQPLPTGVNSSLWAQALSFGLEVRY